MDDAQYWVVKNHDGTVIPLEDLDIKKSGKTTKVWIHWQVVQIKPQSGKHSQLIYRKKAGDQNKK